jgi:hypothetical protein
VPHPPEDRVYIREAARLLDRRMDTLRRWELHNELPEALLPHREPTGRKWRYWTREQLDGIRQWLTETDRRPGKGLPYYDPDADQIQRQLQAMRKPRTTGET